MGVSANARSTTRNASRYPSHRRDVRDSLRDSEGKFTTFDAPGAGTGNYQGTGCFADCPVSLNNRGAITGVYVDANNVYHRCQRNPDGKITTIDPPGSTGTLPYSINDSGAITGYYLDGNNVYHGFLKIQE